MLKIIPNDIFKKRSFYVPPYFEIDGDIKSIVPLKPNPHDFNAVIGVYDAKGLVFEVAQNPSFTPYYSCFCLSSEKGNTERVLGKNW